MQSYKSIVVGTDFSHCSAAAIRQATRLAKASGASLHVLHIIDAFTIAQVEKDLSELQRDISRGLLEDARAEWTNFADKHDLGNAATFEVVIGNRVPLLLQRAASLHADLLVVGAFGDRKPDLGMGTVATGCVRQAPCDVLIVRDTHKGSFRSVLACVDFSDASRKALKRAAQLSTQEHAVLHVLNVFTSPTSAFPFLTSVVADWVRVVTDLEARTLAQLAAFCDCVSPIKPALHVKESVRHVRQIAEFCRSHAIDLLVLGRRGHTNARDVLLGTTAERELRDSGCSVLVVNPLSN